MKYLKYLTLIAFIIIVASCSDDEKGGIIPPPDINPPTVSLPKKELRGMWVTTAWGIDWPMGDYNAATQQKKYIDYLDLLVANKMNAVFFQIRGMADAFYDSEYESWSRYITGTAGMKPSYDVLGFLVEEAHKRNIQFHAWLNPYRISTRGNKGAAFPALDPKIPAELTKDYEKIRIYNPALPEVQTRITQIVKEIITKYDVDGIHMDDYFYPSLESSEKMNDDAEYEKYGKGKFNNIDDFRRNNVDVVIQNIQKTIIETRPEVIFSISPAANMDNNYNVLFADVKKWSKEGWVDVVIPQLYFATGTDANSFNQRLNLWSQYTYENHLLVGYGIYKFGDSTYGSKYQTSEDLKKQFEFAATKSKVAGSVLYSANSLVENKVGIADAIKAIYSQTVLPPYLGRTPAVAPSKPANVKIKGNIMSWDEVTGAHYAVYKSNGESKVASLIQVTKDTKCNLADIGTYFVTAISPDNAESELSEQVSY